MDHLQECGFLPSVWRCSSCLAVIDFVGVHCGLSTNTVISVILDVLTFVVWPEVWSLLGNVPSFEYRSTLCCRLDYPAGGCGRGDGVGLLHPGWCSVWWSCGLSRGHSEVLDHTCRLDVSPQLYRLQPRVFWGSNSWSAFSDVNLATPVSSFCCRCCFAFDYYSSCLSSSVTFSHALTSLNLQWLSYKQHIVQSTFVVHSASLCLLICECTF